MRGLVSLALDLAYGARQVGLFVGLGALTVWALHMDILPERWDRFDVWQLWLLGFAAAYVVWAVGFIVRRNGGWLA